MRRTGVTGAVSTPAILGALVVVGRDVAQGAYYKALIASRNLFELEQERLSYAP